MVTFVSTVALHHKPPTILPSSILSAPINTTSSDKGPLIRPAAGSLPTLLSLVIDSYDPWSLYHAGQRHKESSEKMGYLVAPPPPLFASCHAGLAQRIAHSIQETAKNAEMRALATQYSFDIYNDSRNPPAPAVRLDAPSINVQSPPVSTGLSEPPPQTMCRSRTDSIIWPASVPSVQQGDLTAFSSSPPKTSSDKTKRKARIIQVQEDASYAASSTNLSSSPGNKQYTN